MRQKSKLAMSLLIVSRYVSPATTRSHGSIYKKNLCHPSNLHVQQVMHVVTILPDFYNCMYEFHLRPRGSNGTVVVRLCAIISPVHSTECHYGPSPYAGVTRARRTTLLSDIRRISPSGLDITQRLSLCVKYANKFLCLDGFIVHSLLAALVTENEIS